MFQKIDYYISGVWKDAEKRITHVLLHNVTTNGFKSGIKTTELDVVALINQGKNVFTMYWNYPDWKKGAKVHVESNSNRRFLKTSSNSTTKDNLDNSILISEIINY